MSSKYRIMPLIPDEWNSNAQPAPFENILTIGSDAESGVLAIGYGMFYGQKPEILFLTKTGVFRYTPGNRLGTPTYKGLDEQKYYDKKWEEIFLVEPDEGLPGFIRVQIETKKADVD